MTTIASPFFCRSVQQRVSQWTEFHQLYFFVYDPSNFVNSENVCFFRRKLLFRKNNNVWFVRPFFKCTFLFFSFFQMRWQIKILLFYVRWKMKNVSVCCACWAQKCAIETHWGRNGIWEGGKKSTHIIVEIHWKSVWKRVCCIFVQSAYTSIQCMLDCQLNKTNQMKWKEHGEKKEENEERERRFPSQNQTDHHLWRLFVVGVEYQRERLVTTTARTHRPFLLLLKMCSFCVHSFHPFFVVFFCIVISKLRNTWVLFALSYDSFKLQPLETYIKTYGAQLRMAWIVLLHRFTVFLPAALWFHSFQFWLVFHTIFVRHLVQQMAFSKSSIALTALQTIVGCFFLVICNLNQPRIVCKSQNLYHLLCSLPSHSNRLLFACFAVGIRYRYVYVWCFQMTEENKR